MNKETKANEYYNPLVHVWFEEKGMTPFRIECLLEEVFLDNPDLESRYERIVSSLQESGTYNLSKNLRLVVR